MLRMNQYCQLAEKGEAKMDRRNFTLPTGSNGQPAPSSEVVLLIQAAHEHENAARVYEKAAMVASDTYHLADEGQEAEVTR